MGRKKTISDDELLDIARQVFVEQGYGASTREIARRAGVSEGVIFQRFVTKDELFFGAMIPPPADLSKVFQHSTAKGYALVEEVAFTMVDYFRSLLPVLLPLMAHPGFKFEEFAQRHPQSALSALRRDLTEFFYRQQAIGMLGADPRAAALVVWSTAHAIAFFERLGAHGGRFESEMIRMAVRCLWRGLAPDEKL